MSKVKMSLDNKNKKRVFVAMSGGVDSSVAAMLLKNQDYDVVGVFMRCFNLDGCAEKDAEDARRVAERMGIPFYVWDFEEEYKKRVVKYMVDGYRQGLTPNPDVMCNKEIKFGLFLEKALALGADYVATGHYVLLRKNSASSTRFAHPATRLLVLAASPLGYARKRADHAEAAAGVSDNEFFSLYAAKDRNKDQSYFLWTLTQEQLRHCLFPIGDYLKSEIREIARKAGLPTADKKDSQGICFLGKVTLADFLKTYIPEKRGEVLTARGDKIGEHSGAHFYTIGQRHLGIAYRVPGVKGVRETKPYYLAEKDVKTNVVIVAEGSDNQALYKKEVELCEVNFINPSYFPIRANRKIRVLARVRYRQPLFSASFIIQDSLFQLVFDKPQKFVAPGQSAVFYEASPSTSSGLKMLGGGVIV